MSQDGEEMSIRESHAALKEISREKRAGNRESSAQFLDERGVKYSECNHGAHLIVEGKDQTIDFWPGTGRFIGRKDKRCDGRGVRNLIKYCDAKAIIRPELVKFVKAMEDKLKQNDHKGGWSNESYMGLYDLMEEGMNELFEVIQGGDSDEIRKEAADVANYAMMIFDNCGE